MFKFPQPSNQKNKKKEEDEENVVYIYSFFIPLWNNLLSQLILKKNEEKP